MVLLRGIINGPKADYSVASVKCLYIRMSRHRQVLGGLWVTEYIMGHENYDGNVCEE